MVRRWCSLARWRFDVRPDKRHEYTAEVVWEGDPDATTFAYASYSRRYRVAIDGKPDLAGSADPMFRGEADRHNPEDLLVTAVATCHMLSYLALCSLQGIVVLAYSDRPRGTLVLTSGGGGKFEEVVLAPRVTIAAGSDLAAAEALHARAHEVCFIANSCNFPIRHEAEVRHP
jgi:organic hydroperoxide reductase OsmC/OhrA